MPGHDIIVVGASTGGVEALRSIAGGLPADLPAAVFVVLHMPAGAHSMLAHLLARAGRLPAVQAVGGELIQDGRIYCARPDFHLIVRRGHVELAHGPRENRSRPAVDVLFRTAARAYGPRVVGVVLTGALNDGTAGLFAIKRCGGVAVVQEPRDAFFPDMPESALAYVAVDHREPLARIPALLARLARDPAPDEGAFPVPADLDIESDIAVDGAAAHAARPGQLTGFTCPECKGPMWQIDDGALVRYRCRVGHAYTAEAMLAAQSEDVEAALWVALETLEESANVARRLAERSRQHHTPLAAVRLEERARRADERADVIRRGLLNGLTGAPTAEPSGEARGELAGSAIGE
jgi:two-component system chemotaxis response regulator CheB